MSQKKFTPFAGCEIKSMRLTFKTKMLIYQSEGKVHVKFLFSKITHHLDPEIRTMLGKGVFGNEDSTFHPGPEFTCYLN